MSDTDTPKVSMKEKYRNNKTRGVYALRARVDAAKMRKEDNAISTDKFYELFELPKGAMPIKWITLIPTAFTTSSIKVDIGKEGSAMNEVKNDLDLTTADDDGTVVSSSSLTDKVMAKRTSIGMKFSVDADSDTEKGVVELICVYVDTETGLDNYSG